MKLHKRLKGTFRKKNYKEEEEGSRIADELLGDRIQCVCLCHMTATSDKMII